MRLLNSMSSSYVLASLYGYPISWTSTTQDLSSGMQYYKRKLLSLSRLAATVASASPQ
jgi:hypothetical protein